MYWLIASDLHGSAYYCEKLMEAFRRESADRMLLLGDLLYHGPRNDLPRDYAPKKVIEMLNSMAGHIMAVRGNCEAEVDAMVLKFPVMADYALLSMGNRVIFATHGHVFNGEHLPPLQMGDILLHGHTHVPKCEQTDGIWVLNPGSLSIPKEGSAHGYMLFDGSRFVWKTLDGDEYLSFEPEEK